MLADRAMADTSKLQLPADLLAELQRRGPTPKLDMRVDGWKKRSILARLLEFVTGKRAH